MKKYLVLFLSCVSIVCYSQELPPGVIIAHSPGNSGIYIGEPSICILPNGDYVASYNEFGPQSGEYASGVTHIFSSSDKGASWNEISVIRGLTASNMFAYDQVLYIIGTNKTHGNYVLIRKSTDGGKTWTTPRDGKTGVLFEGVYLTNSPTMVVHNGRIWRAVEYVAGPIFDGDPYEGRPFSPMVISAPVNADLLDAGNWRKSNYVTFDRTWLEGKFQMWVEGNVVISPEGKLLNIIRVEIPAGVDEHVAFVEISKNGKKASFNPKTGFVKFPGGKKRYSIKYDPQTKRYWVINNIIAPQFRELNPGIVRNQLALSSSTDLRNWQIHEVLLSHPDILHHGFQYPDWQFEGDDIIFVSRTAFDDETGGAHNYHDANYLTFHRITDFRQLVGNK